MTVQQLHHKLKTNPNSILFLETMQAIENTYLFTPVAFKNGNLENGAHQNTGSCKLFAFAVHQQTTKEQTLACFGEHYKSVLEDENGASHQNIRNFMKTGFKGLTFEGDALQIKK